jgi:hypothetical protein
VVPQSAAPKIREQQAAQIGLRPREARLAKLPDGVAVIAQGPR